MTNGDFQLTESKAVTWYLCDKYCPRLLGASAADKARIDMCYQLIYDGGFMTLIKTCFSTDDRSAVAEVGI